MVRVIAYVEVRDVGVWDVKSRESSKIDLTGACYEIGRNDDPARSYRTPGNSLVTTIGQLRIVHTASLAIA